MPVSKRWRLWLGEFAVAMDRLHVTKLSPAATASPLLNTALLAVYARLRSELETALILADAKRDMAFRNACRSIIECALHIEMADGDPTYIDRLTEDDNVSRKGRAARFRKKQKLTPAADKTLSDFVLRLSDQKAKLQVSEYATVLPRLTHHYREISADTTHVSLTSIQRHVRPDRAGVDRLHIEPKFNWLEMEEASSLIALSLLNATRVLLVRMPEIQRTTYLADLQRRYRALYEKGLRKLKREEQKIAASGKP